MYPQPVICVTSRPLVKTCGLGTVCLLGSILVIRPELVAVILLLAAFLIVPLGTRFVRRQASGSMPDRLLRTLCPWQLAAAVSLAASVAVPVGWWSMTLALPWMLVTWLIALCGLIHFARRPRKFADRDQLGIDVAMVFLAMGGTWAVWHRGGWWPGDFPPVIAQLTAVHFHYAGFALPLIAGQVSAAARVRGAGIVVPALAVSTLLLALGITFSPVLELFSAWLLIGTAIAVGSLQLRFAFRQTRPAMLSLFAISSVALLSGMGLAGVYAVGEYLGAVAEQDPYTGGAWIDIPLMIRLHGVTLSCGFALPAMLALSLPPTPPGRWPTAAELSPHPQMTRSPLPDDQRPDQRSPASTRRR